MGQVTIYLEKEIEDKMILAAQTAHMSKSKWIADIIKKNINEEWSKSIQPLSGSWADFPTLDDIRTNSQIDADREPF